DLAVDGDGDSRRADVDADPRERVEQARALLQLDWVAIEDYHLATSSLRLGVSARVRPCRASPRGRLSTGLFTPSPRRSALAAPARPSAARAGCRCGSDL